MKALKAQSENKFINDIVPIDVEQVYIDKTGKKQQKTYTVSKDEGPRKGTSIEALSKLRPVFAQEEVLLLEIHLK